MTDSPEQLAFYEALRATTDSILLVASAGSGKTTTIVNACRRLAPGLSARFVAFNKDIAEALATRLPPSVTASTFHSVGYEALTNAAKSNGFPRPDLNLDKSRVALHKHLSPREFGHVAAPVCKLVGLMKNSGTESNPITVARHYALDIPEESTLERVADIATKLLDATRRDLSCVDYDDMLYLPMFHGFALPQSNLVFVDEAQDTNAIQLAMLKRMIFGAPWGRVVAVGDPFQAIYGFRGADADAMTNLRSAFNMTEMPLSVSWRCSQSVVAEAQRALGHRASEGLAETGKAL